MSKNPTEKYPTGEGPKLLETDGSPTRVGEWATYLKCLGTGYAVRRDTPAVIDPEDTFDLSYVPLPQLDEFLSKESPDLTIDPTAFWQTRLENLQREIDKVGPDNSKLGISLLTLKGYIQSRLTSVSPQTQILEHEQQTGLENMFGNGLKVKSLSADTVKLTPVNPTDKDLISIRTEALGRLGACYEYAEMIKVPRVRSISPTGDFVEVDKAPGFSLVSINREQQTAVAELPIKLRQRIIKQFLRGVDIFNLQGFVFGDYNETSFHFDLAQNQLWIIDPGVSEKKEYANPRVYEEVAREEVFKMLDGNGFYSMLDIFGVSPTIVQEIKRKNTQKELSNVGQIIDLL